MATHVPPCVSVIIPTHNRAALVAQAIDSVLAQTYRDFEVVVCDDGSTDETGERVRGYGPPVRYLRVEHTSRPGAVRNRAVGASVGQLIAFLDDDDLWEPQKLARQVERITRDPGLDAVYTDRAVLGRDGSRLDGVASPEPDVDGRLLDQVLAGHFPHACSLLVRRQALARIGGWDENLRTAEDLALWLRIGRAGRVARVPEPLLLVRRQSDSLSDQSGPQALTNAIAVLEIELANGDLSRFQRLRCRRTLALLHARHAIALAQGREWPAARRAAARAILRFPASRNAWRAAAQVWLARAPLSHRGALTR